MHCRLSLASDATLSVFGSPGEAKAKSGPIGDAVLLNTQRKRSNVLFIVADDSGEGLFYPELPRLSTPLFSALKSLYPRGYKTPEI
jgi:hypothetical protein